MLLDSYQHPGKGFPGSLHASLIKVVKFPIFQFLLNHLALNMKIFEVQNSQVTKSSYKINLRKMTSHFELLTQKFLLKFFFRVTNTTL